MQRALMSLLLATAAPTVLAQGYATQVYNGPGWVSYGCSTYPLNLSTTPTGTGVQDPNLVYSPVHAWNGYAWLLNSDTDSAAAATAISTGQKSYNKAINWSDLDAAITPTIVELAHDWGKATGTVSTVPFSHATPAALSNAHHVNRDGYAPLANQMLDGGILDVIMGCGNPDFNDNGQPATRNPLFVGGLATWNRLKAGTHAGGWQLRQTLDDFQSLTTGDPTGRFLGVPQVYTTLQQARTPGQDWDGNGTINMADALAAPVHDPGRNSYGDAPNAGLPTLELMTRGSLNILDADPDGFFLHVEGGAVDWAGHANQKARLIEEQLDFHRAVEAAVDWVETSSSWDETLLVITADHETGLLWGPDSDAVSFAPLVDNGEGQLPGMRFNATSHANSLVPVYARGVGAALLASLVDGSDATAAMQWGVGEYIDNTDVFTLMATSGAKNIILMISDGAGFNTFNAASMWEGRWVPEPASPALLLAALAFRRR